MELDFTSQAHYLVALLPEVILSVWGMVILVAGVSRSEDQGWEWSGRIGWLTAAGLGVAAAANGWLYTVVEVGEGSMIAVDRFRLFANWIILLAAVFSVLISFAYVARQRIQVAEYYGLIVFSTVGMMLMAAARDLIVVFLGLEVMSVAVYALAALNRRDRKSAEAGLKYFILGAFSTGFFLYGIALVYGATGTTNIAEIGAAVTGGAIHFGFLVAGIALLAIGFGFKVAVVPFHMWTPDVYEGSPAPVTAFMSASVKAAAFVAFLRVFFVAFQGVYESWWAILWWLAALTMVVANLIALVQSNVKRMLAYSSIAHAGYLLVAIVALNEIAAAGLLFYLLVYALMNIGAFAIVITVAGQGEDRLQVEDYSGFGWQQPALGIFLTIFLLSLAGFPGTGGFMGKIFLLQGAVGGGLRTLAVILVLTTLLSYWYYLRVAWYMWMKEAPAADEDRAVFLPGAMRAALLVGAVLVVLTGVLPGAPLAWAQASVEGLAPFTGILGFGP
ncbi:MAG: NADH-quinone oxidoreductase subunit N [Longimicrobiales bacterium]|nr:NADH-quinone oxidoreductase subunit N [Longimicrobiales bacterium]